MMRKNTVNIIQSLAVALAMLGVTVFGNVAAASEYTLSQTIFDCNHNTLETYHVVNDVRCDVFSPTYLKKEMVSGGTVLYGAYDAAHTITNPDTGVHDLTIEINGRQFVLGKDSELRVSGNSWILDLSRFDDGHLDGIERTYNGKILVKVQAHGSNTVESQSANFSFKMTLIEIISEVISDIRGALANTGGNLWIILTVSFSFITIATFIFLIAFKKTKRRLDV